VSAAYQPHPSSNLVNARDHLSETIIWLRSATERLTGDELLEAAGLLRALTEDIGPRLARLRADTLERAAAERAR
jgi:hypothetical protein